MEYGTGRTDGDVISINSETNQLSMNVSDEEIAARLKKWKAPRLKVNRGTLAKYVHLVGDASHGVCFYLASFFLYLFIFYFTSFRPYIISHAYIFPVFEPAISLCCNEGLDVSKSPSLAFHDLQQSFVSSTGADEDIPCGC